MIKFLYFKLKTYLRVLTNPGLKPTFKYAANLNSVADIQNSAHAKSHGLKILTQIGSVIDHIADTAHNDKELQTLGNFTIILKLHKVFNNNFIV